MKKKLIEVALPLEAINKASAREKSIRHGHPSTLHLWWARRPLAAARAVIFAQMVDDPSGYPDLFPTEKKQEKERQRLFRIIEDLVIWENTTNEEVLGRARAEIWQSWRSACAENVEHPGAKQLFNRHKLPAFHDPFAGGGSLPLEAQRLGLEAHASDLNPVAVLINKAMIEIPPKFVGRPPINPKMRGEQSLDPRQWQGAQGLAEDVRYYGQWMRDEAEKRIGHLYPKIDVTEDMAKDRPDLRRYVNKKLTVIAWLWARTVKSPNPAFANIDVPLASTFLLSKMKGNEAYVEPVVDGGGYHFTVKVGNSKDAEAVKNGTRLSRGANFRCLMSGTPISGDYIKSEGRAGRMRARMIAIVAGGERGRVYLQPSEAMEAIARDAKPEWKPDVVISGSTQYLGVKPYGMLQFSQLFTDRQLVAMTTFADLVHEACEFAKRDALIAGLRDDRMPLAEGGDAALAYAEAIGVYLGFVISSLADRLCAICNWDVGGATWGTKINHAFGRQAIQMSWDFAEANPLSNQSGSFKNSLDYTSKGVIASGGMPGTARQEDAATQKWSSGKIVSTDPPYFDNVPYADLSDFFYVWLRRALRPIFPDLFATLAVPKTEELVAFAYRHASKEAAGDFFMNGMGRAMHQLAENAHPGFPITIYYAFRQSETDDNEGTSSTGWETFLDAVIRAGLAITGTWPMRTELLTGLKAKKNSLASSIILVCRHREIDSPTATRQEFLRVLKAELPVALTTLQRSNIAPVDLAQAAIGPGMAVYTRYASVLDAEGKSLSVREALALINQILDEVLTEQEGDFDSDSRWAVAWFEQIGFAEGEYGVAETLSKAKNTSVAGMVAARIAASKAGKVRLLKPHELPADWDPTRDSRLTAWEAVHHLIRVLETGGEGPAAVMAAKLGARAEIARELTYRLYVICERKKRTIEALAYNGLVQSWPEISRLAREGSASQPAQAQLFEEV